MSLNKIASLKKRRSIREYTSKEISDRFLNLILDAAAWAPSAHNSQPWHFVVVKDSGTKMKLALAMANQWRRDLAKDGVAEKDRNNLADVSVERFSKASVIIVPCLIMSEMQCYRDKRRQRIEFVMGVQSVAAAIENLLLAAHGLGLGSCWFCAPLFCPKTVREALNISPESEPQALITLGYPAFQPRAPPRKALKEITHLTCCE